MTRSIALLSALALSAAVAATSIGCAEAMTFSRTERSQGRILLQEGDPNGAALIFTTQLKRNPKDYKAHYHLGEARWAMGYYPEAIQSFKTALDVRKVTPMGKNDDEYRSAIIEALSTALAEYDTDTTMLASYEQVAETDRDRALLIAKTYGKAGRPDEAIAAYRMATALGPRDPEIAKNYGLYLESLKEHAAAEAVLRTAYRLDTRDQEVAAALLRLGVVPGPAILSRNELATPYVPLGPIKPIRPAEQASGTDETRRPSGIFGRPQTGPQDTSPHRPSRTTPQASPDLAPVRPQDPTLN